MIKTHCYNCYFATRENGKQVGCYFNRLDKFDKVWSDIEQSWVIQRLCTRFRGKECNPLTVIEQSRVKVDCIVLFQQENYEKLTQILDRLKEFQPNKIIVCSSLNIDYSHLLTVCKNRASVVRVFDNNIIDEGVRKGDGNYYTVITEDTCLDENFIADLQDRVEERLEQVSMIENNDLYIINKALHNWVGGNKGMPVTEKIKQLYESNLSNSQS